MTEAQKVKILKMATHPKGVTRLQIRCLLSSDDKDNHAIGLLTSFSDSPFLRLVSIPRWEKGRFIPMDDDVFSITDAGIDFLSKRAKDRRRFLISVVISILALISSLAGWVALILGLSSTG